MRLRVASLHPPYWYPCCDSSLLSIELGLYDGGELKPNDDKGRRTRRAVISALCRVRGVVKVEKWIQRLEAVSRWKFECGWVSQIFGLQECKWR